MATEMNPAMLDIDDKLIAKVQQQVRKESHQAANMLPMMDREETLSLVWSILSNGFDAKQPVRKNAGKIWDGRNREAAVRIINEMETAAAKVEEREPKYVKAKYDEKDNLDEVTILRQVMEFNFARRNLSSGQRAAIVVKSGMLAEAAAKYRNATEEERREAEKFRFEISHMVAAKSGTNAQYIHICKRLLEDGKNSLLDRIISGEIGPVDAQKVARAEAGGEEVKPKTTRQKPEPEVRAAGDEGNADPKPGQTGDGVGGVGKTEPDAEEQVIDELGNVVPEKLHKVFAIRHAINRDLTQPIRQCIADYRAMGMTDGGIAFAAEQKEALSSLRRAGAIVAASTPYCLCPHCDATGKEADGKKTKTCTVCAGYQWITKGVYTTWQKHGLGGVQTADSDAKADADDADAKGEK